MSYRIREFEWKKLESAGISGVERNICTLKELLLKYRALGCRVEKQDTWVGKGRPLVTKEHVGDISFRT